MKVALADGREFEVDFKITSYGSPDSDLPGHICDGGGDGPEIEVEHVYTADGSTEVFPDDQTREAIDLRIYETADFTPDYYEDFE